MNGVQWVLAASTVPIFLTAVYAALRYRRIPIEVQPVAWYTFLSAPLQLVSLTLWSLGKNNMPVLHFFVPAGFVLLAWFYHRLLADYLSQVVVPSLTAGFVLFSLANSLFWQDWFSFNSHALTVQAGLFVMLSLSAFSLLLNREVQFGASHTRNGLQWINSGVFIYFTSNLLLYYFGTLIMHEFPIALSRYTWLLHAAFNTVLYLCIFTGLWQQSRN